MLRRFSMGRSTSCNGRSDRCELRGASAVARTRVRAVLERCRAVLEPPLHRSGAGNRFTWCGVATHRANHFAAQASYHRSRRAAMRNFGRDLQLALRGMRRRPAHALAVIATLAVGIGANTAIFSVFNWILFRPMPGVQRPGEMVTVRFVRANAPGARLVVSYRDLADPRGSGPALSRLTAATAVSLNVSLERGADPARLEGELVTANYFDVLGVTPQAGRRFLPAEERPGSDTPGAII